MNVTAATNAAVPLSGLALEIAVSAKSGKSRFEIRLDPADLGRIDVRIDVDRNGQVTSHLTVEKPETLSMLRQDAPQLQRALDDAGLRTGNGGLQFSLRDQSSSGQDNGSGSGRNAHRLIVEEDYHPRGSRGTNLWPHARIEQRRRHQSLRSSHVSRCNNADDGRIGTGERQAPTKPPPLPRRRPGIADNFQTFLTLLTTQLQNQNPLDPLDTNQFTQQLVQFAGVEQQLKSNDQLKSLIAIEKSAQATQALIYVGNTVAVDGSTTQFDGSATWNLEGPKGHERHDHDHQLDRPDGL